MPFTGNFATTPVGLAVNGAYVKIRDIRAPNCTLVAGAAQEPSWEVVLEYYASEAAFTAGAQPGFTQRVPITLASPAMPAFETAVLAYLTEVPGATSVAAVNS